MLYTKRPDEKWTDLCIFFDNNFYSDNRDDSACYRILYLLYYMLGCKKKLFTTLGGFQSFDKYDAYAQFSATIIWKRLIEKMKRNEEPVKSILNYVKSTVYPNKIIFLKDDFQSTLDETSCGKKFDPEAFKNTYRESVQSQYNYILRDRICDVFIEIPSIIKKCILESERPYTDTEYNRIYKSCFITFLKSVTLSQESIEKLHIEDETKEVSVKKLTRCFIEERKSALTLWKLDSSYSSIISSLMQKINTEVINNIYATKQQYSLDTDTLDSVIATAWDETSHNKLDAVSMFSEGGEW